MPFTDEAWDGPEAEASMSAEQFCSICLIDLNPEGKEKVKGLCKLPLKRSPGAPYNKAAIRNAMGRIFGTDAPAEEKRKAARKLARLAAEAGVEIGSAAFRKLAGLKK